MKKFCLVVVSVILIAGTMGLASAGPADPCTDVDPICPPPPCTDVNPEGCPEPAVPSCRASAVRVELLQLEPWVANDQNVPCVAEETGLIPPTTIGPVGAAVLFARTRVTGTGGDAFAGAAVVTIGTAIAAQAANASAEADCSGDAPSFTSSSTVVGLTIGGQPIDVPPGHFEIAIPLVGTLHLNETISTPTSVTQRAIWLDSPILDDIVVGEAEADCASPA